MQEALYKPSMFNRIVVKNGKMALYNSKIGSQSIRLVQPEYQEEVRSILNDSAQLDDKPLVNALVKQGYLVDFGCNEKHIREYLYNTYAFDNTLHVVVHLTQDCNFRCVYCYMNFKKKRITDATQDGILNFIRKKIRNYKAVVLSWFGGEPLLEIKVIEDLSRKIISICDKLNKPYSAVITTNGYLLSPKNIDILLRSKVTTISVTIDGLKNTHDTQRVLSNGDGTYDKIIENLQYIKNEVKFRFAEIIIRSNVTINHLDKISEYYHCYDELFGDDSRFSLFIRPVLDYGGERIKTINDSLLDSMSFVYDLLSEENGKLEYKINYKDLDIGGYSCSSKCHNKFTIGCDGAIHKCDEDLSTPLGLLDRTGKMDINLSLYSKWMSAFARPECDDCFFSPCCLMESCPKIRVFDNTTSKCSVSFNEVDSLIMLIAKKRNAYIV